MDDLGALPLAALATYDYRAEGRDPVADARTVHLRVAAVLADLPDAAFDREVSASAVPGAPAWTVRDHVGHAIDALEDAAGYTRAVVDGGARWPEVADYGDMDAWNEERRPSFAHLSPAALRTRYDAATDALIGEVEGLSPEDAASDDAWGWAWSILHEHVAEHVALAEAAVRA
jgi:hypothetical protein